MDKANVLDGNDESQNSSLSDCHDYEPQLEFDDSELTEANQIVKAEESFDYMESPVSDGTIEENFEVELGMRDPGTTNGYASIELAQEAGLTGAAGVEDFSDIASHGILEVAGDDNYGRKLIVISACKLPSNKAFDHHRFLRYLIATLDCYVENDYSLVYFHNGLSSCNKPPLSWLWNAFKAFDRKYKKNLKEVYLVHPTSFIKMILGVFKPVVSAKFGRKLVYINCLNELKQHLHLDQLYIPKQVIEYDEKLSRSKKFSNTNASNSLSFHTQFGTQQFDVTLDFIKDNNNGDPIPPVIHDCVEYLENPDVLETEGLFRRCAKTSDIKEAKCAYNEGRSVHFEAKGDPHLAAVILKTFLRELREPLLTYDLYHEILSFQTLDKHEKLEVAKVLIIDRLPDDNYVLLKYLVGFLDKVMDRCDLNKMTASNLAIVFAPNLIWAENRQQTLSAMAPINHFTEFLIQHREFIFLK